MDSMRFHKTAALVLALLLAMVVFTPGIAQQNDQAEVMLQAAQNKQLVDGDLSQAIQMYKKILSEYSANRPVAAKALVEMGDCYEKLGKSEALKAYQRVLRDYADQSAEASQARARLAALEHSGAQGKEMVARRIWAGTQADVEGGVTADGRLLSYPDWNTGDLAVRDLVTGQNRHVTRKGSWANSGEFAENSVPSPDGRQIAYAWFNKDQFYELRVIDTDGSNFRVLYRNPQVNYIEPKSWSPDGKKILGLFWKDQNQKCEIMEISTADGSARLLKTFKPRMGEGPDAMYSPDGRYIAYDLPQAGNSRDNDIYVASTKGGPDAPLVRSPSDDFLLGWAPDCRSIVFASDRLGSYGLWSVDIRDGKPIGSPKLLKADIGLAWPLGVSRDGSLYYGINTPTWDAYTASFDFSDGKLLQPPALISQAFAGRNMGAAWSPDGKYLAYLSRRRRLNGFQPDTIVIRSLQSGRERELVPNLQWMGPPFGLRWSADGRSFYVWGLDKVGRAGIYTVNGQTGKASSLFGSNHEPGWAQNVEELPQGKFSVLLRNNFQKQSDAELILRNKISGQERVLFHIARPAFISGFVVSPDGRQVAVTTWGGPTALRVVPVAGGDARVLLQPKAPKGFTSGALAWTPDGSHVVFVENTESQHPKMELMEISAQGGEPLDLGISFPIIVFQTHSVTAEVWVIRNLLPTLKASR
jgi:Tol biopolymer transport system component